MHLHESAIGIHMSPPSASHLPPHPSPLSCHRALDWASCITQQNPIGSLFYRSWCICFSSILSLHPTLSFPDCVHKPALCGCVSIAALQIGSSVPCLTVPFNVWHFSAMKEYWESSLFSLVAPLMMKRVSSFFLVCHLWLSCSGEEGCEVESWHGIASCSSPPETNSFGPFSSLSSSANKAFSLIPENAPSALL